MDQMAADEGQKQRREARGSLVRWPGKVMRPAEEDFYCPGCTETVEETCWVYQGRWYCSEKCCRVAAAGY